MFWDRVIGQKRVVDLLQGAVESGHVAHAYLFHGLDGTGKRAVALAFAHALLCKRCGKPPPCSSCKQVQALQHPDVLFMIPQPSDAKSDDVNFRIHMLSEDPYAANDFKRAPNLDNSKKTTKGLKQARYSVDRINLDLRSKMVMRPSIGAYRIAIITDIDAIHERAANGFLKLLEEPGPDTIFILTTSRKDLLLPTILSRCQHVAFENLSSDDIATALQERNGLDSGLSELVAQMSQGSYMRAVQLGQSDELKHDRQRVLKFLRFAFSGPISEQLNLITEIGQSSRDGIKNLLKLLLSWIRDISLYQSMGEEAPLVNSDQKQHIIKFCRNLPDADLEAMHRLTEEALTLTEFNINTTLLLTNLSTHLGQAMRSFHTRKLYTPLSSPFQS
ncbi:MAG: DNA polymerase III subunit delta' [Bacteroidetes bacterium]|nr:DNA polymerase III subunit delta' [Bacteroidota bacterium]